MILNKNYYEYFIVLLQIKLEYMLIKMIYQLRIKHKRCFYMYYLVFDRFIHKDLKFLIY